MPGVYDLGEEKVRPGLYVHFESVAVARVRGGPRGIVAIPVTANWGPENTIVVLESETAAIDTFGSDLEGVTAYRACREAFRGGAAQILAYRIAVSATKASATLNDDAATPAQVVRLEAKYTGTRGNSFSITVRESIVDPTMLEVLLYEGTKLLKKWTVAKATSVNDIVSAINSDETNVWIVASKVADGTGKLGVISNSAFANGNSGITGITNDDYLIALTAFEARPMNVLALDKVPEAQLMASVAAWVDRVRGEGKRVMWVCGGSTTEDQDPTIGNSRSTSLNHEGIVNLITGVEYPDGTRLSSGEFASRIAGMIASRGLAESITYSVVSGISDVIPRLTNSQTIDALNAGSLVLVSDGERIFVEQGITTLTSLGTDQDEGWKKIRRVRTRDTIMEDLIRTANISWVGKINNDDDGRKALIGAIGKYFDTLVSAGALRAGYTVEVDPDNPPFGDTATFLISYVDLDSLERIYLRMRFGE